MKALKLFMGLVCLLVQANFIGLSAQSALDSLMEGYKKNDLIQKLIETDVCGDSVSSFSIQFFIEDKQLVDEFLEVFKKEKRSASSIIQKKENKKLFLEACFFDDGEAIRSYSYSLKNEGTSAEITYAKYNTVPHEKHNRNDQATAVKYLIPKGGYMFLNGEKVSAEEARAKGLNVEEL
jgi:hypothetical protein